MGAKIENTKVCLHKLDIHINKKHLQYMSMSDNGKFTCRYSCLFS